MIVESNIASSVAACVTGNADTGAASAPDSPLRAFWREPDYEALMAAGHDLEATRLTAQQRQIEKGEVDVKAVPGVELPWSHPPQREVIPEFEAMKQALAKGVVASGPWDVGTVKVKLSKHVYEMTLDSTKTLKVVCNCGVGLDRSV
jgi:hypothetical protein